MHRVRKGNSTNYTFLHSRGQTVSIRIKVPNKATWKEFSPAQKVSCIVESTIWGHCPVGEETDSGTGRDSAPECRSVLVSRSHWSTRSVCQGAVKSQHPPMPSKPKQIYDPKHDCRPAVEEFDTPAGNWGEKSTSVYLFQGNLIWLTCMIYPSMMAQQARLAETHTLLGRVLQMAWNSATLCHYHQSDWVGSGKLHEVPIFGRKSHWYGPLAGNAKLRVAHALGMPGTFSLLPTSKETAS